MVPALVIVRRNTGRHAVAGVVALSVWAGGQAAWGALLAPPSGDWVGQPAAVCAVSVAGSSSDRASGPLPAARKAPSLPGDGSLLPCEATTFGMASPPISGSCTAAGGWLCLPPPSDVLMQQVISGCVCDLWRAPLSFEPGCDLLRPPRG